MLQFVYDPATGVEYPPAIISPEANRIDTSVAITQIWYLFKFTNDMTGDVVYVYPEKGVGAQVQSDRYFTAFFSSLLTTVDNNFSLYGIDGLINFVPNGYWKYEVYEVSWKTGWTVTIDITHAPKNENNEFVGEPAATYGVANGLVCIGKAYVSEEVGNEEVQYTEYTRPAATNYVYQGD
tara:strand:- start:630 stop:1169 length:540 start_codon:yes stop_codon:yes gene_type:complete